MLRLISAVARISRSCQLLAAPGSQQVAKPASLARNFCLLTAQTNAPITFLAKLSQTLPASRSILPSAPAANCFLQPARTVTKFSLNKGKRKSVKAVIKRFKRLDWGAWIRTRCGRHKKMWRKSIALKRRLRQHIFVNGQQSMLLDKMVTQFWRRPKYYIEDPYTPYHTRNEFPITRRPKEKY